MLTSAQIMFKNAINLFGEAKEHATGTDIQRLADGMLKMAEGLRLLSVDIHNLRDAVDHPKK